MRTDIAAHTSSDVATINSFSGTIGEISDAVLTNYQARLRGLLDEEYATLKGTIYLDHAGTTPYAQSLIANYTAELTSHLFGNPHSASASSQLTTRRIDDIRLKALQFFGASSEDFELVFVSNATAAIRLVAECLRDAPGGFAFHYHRDAHTSVIGCRELATRGSECFTADSDVDEWIASLRCTQPASAQPVIQLFAYPGQSNMTGRRLPARWCHEIRAVSNAGDSRVLTLLDAASLASTTPIDFHDATMAPDFMAVSFYKIFGFPDLGALIVRKDAAKALSYRKYFAGGTVDAVTAGTRQIDWHAKKSYIHAALEEGTLPFHNILALEHAIETQRKLFSSVAHVSRHVLDITRIAVRLLRVLQHSNGRKVVELYRDEDDRSYGPIIAFNLIDSMGRYHSPAEVEKLCIVKGIQLRTGGLCNPGGIAHHLNLSSDLVKGQYMAGKRCGDGNDIIEGRPMSAIRISFGAMSTHDDVDALLCFLRDFFVDELPTRSSPKSISQSETKPQYFIDHLAVFPIKSCAAFHIPRARRWLLTAAGLAWDREWCLVHAGTYTALSQKKYPRMALFEPTIDLDSRRMTIKFRSGSTSRVLEIALDSDDETIMVQTAASCGRKGYRLQRSNVCNETVMLQLYTAVNVNTFFTNILGVPCCLARSTKGMTMRTLKLRKPKGHKTDPEESVGRQMKLANESPLLIVSLSSVKELNQKIEDNANMHGSSFTRVTADSFRGNIVVAERLTQTPYHEDTWKTMQIMSDKIDGLLSDDHNGGESSAGSCSDSEHSSIASDSATLTTNNSASAASSRSARELKPPGVLALDVLGPCQRCQMVSINQDTGVSAHEPYATLAKTRRKGDGRVWFGVHASLRLDGEDMCEERYIQAGDNISVSSIVSSIPLG